MGTKRQDIRDKVNKAHWFPSVLNIGRAAIGGDIVRFEESRSQEARMAGLTQWQERANEVSREDYAGHRTRLSINQTPSAFVSRSYRFRIPRTHRKRLVRVHHVSKDAHDHGKECESEHGESDQGNKPKDLSVGGP